MWEQSLYAFLLRRFLRQYLTPSSAEKLHESIEVSLNDGSLVLRDIELDPAYLTTLLAQKGKVQLASVGKLSIRLSLQQKSDKEDTITKTTTSGGTVSLFAHVVIDGIDLAIAPPDATTATSTGAAAEAGSARPKTEGTTSKAPEKATKSSGMIASYMEAALSSLRLSVQLTDITVRTLVPATGGQPRWAKTHLDSASYHDLLAKHDTWAASSAEAESSSFRMMGWKQQQLQQPSSEVCLYKAVEFSGLSMTVDNAKGEAPVVLELLGVGQARLRVVAVDQDGRKQDKFSPLHMSCSSSSSSTFLEGSKESKRLFRHDVEVFFDQRWTCQVDMDTMVAIHHMLDQFSFEDRSETPAATPQQQRQRRDSIASQSLLRKESLGITDDGGDDDEDEKDASLLSNILTNYADARNSAQTREIRGGILVPNIGGGEVTFDTFFDANDQSLYHYRSIVPGEGLSLTNIADDNNNDDEEDGNDRHVNIKFHLKEGGLHVWLGHKDTPDVRSLSLTFADWNVTYSVTGRDWELSTSLSQISVMESKRFPLIQFLENTTAVGDELVVSEAPCVSAEVTFRRAEGAPFVNVVFMPFEVTARPSTVANALKFRDELQDASMGAAGAEKPQQEVVAPKKASFQAQIACSCVTLLLPMEDESTSEAAKVLRRCREPSCAATPTSGVSFGLTIDTVVLFVSDVPCGQTTAAAAAAVPAGYIPTHGVGQTATASCDSLIVSVSLPTAGKTGAAMNNVVFDLAALCSEAHIESSSVVRVAYRRFCKDDNETRRVRGSAFPVVPQLSSIRARQQQDDSKVVARSHGPDVVKSIMNDATKIESLVEVNVPSLIVGATISEIAFILQCMEKISDGPLSAARRPAPESPRSDANGALASMDDDEYDEISTATPISADPTLGFALNCDHLAATLFDNDTAAKGTNGDDARLFYTLALDGLKIHSALGESGLKNLRMLSHDFCFYEGFNPVPPPKAQRPTSGHWWEQSLRDVNVNRCQHVRLHSVRKCEKAVPLLFRSKSCHPISPTSPAALVDMVQTPTGLDEDDEKLVRVTIYDVTHRYEAESSWPDRLAKMLKKLSEVSSGTKQEDDARIKEDDVQSVINLVVTLSDFTLDYTTPRRFKIASRSLIRLGEVRLSSHLLLPMGPVQAFKVSLLDAAFNLCNMRHSMDEENTRLSCSRQLLNLSAEMYRKYWNLGSSSSLEDMLRRLNFVTVATLDSMDSTVTVANKDAKEQSHPLHTVTVRAGEVCLSTCRDSFACFTDTCNELVALMTALSEEELESLRQEAVPNFDKGRRNDTIVGDVPVEASSRDRWRPHPTVFGMEDPSGTGKLSGAVSSDLFVAEEPPQKEERKTATLFPAVIEYDDRGRDLRKVPDSELSASELRKKHGMASAAREAASKSGLHPHSESEFVLDGWTAVDHEWSRNTNIPYGANQTTKWLDEESTAGAPSAHIYGSSGSLAVTSQNALHIYPQHVSLRTSVDAIGGQQDETRPSAPPVVTRVVVTKMALSIRLFDGDDWHIARRKNLVQPPQQAGPPPSQRRQHLMSELLADPSEGNEGSKRQSVFANETVSETTRSTRDLNRYVHFAMSGVQVQHDAYDRASGSRLSSCTDIKAFDFFGAETVSTDRPVKMVGEWLNEREHPRDCNDGLLMMKMVTMLPTRRMSADGKLMGDEARVSLELLPLRCFVYQRTITYISKFFSSDPEAEATPHAEHDSPIRPENAVTMFFPEFKVKPLKLKVDYRPKAVDTDSLRDGNLVELINLLPLEDMVLTLQPVDIMNMTGWGDVMGELTGRWVGDICDTQIHKFLTNATPFQPLTNLGSGVADLVMIPLEEYRNDGNLIRAIRKGTTSFAGTVAYEALNTTAKLTKFAADKLSGGGTSRQKESGAHESSSFPSSSPIVSLPLRPNPPPRNVADAMGHAYESLFQGVREANYKVVIVPYREYRREGATGAAKSVLKGLPVAIRAPLGGASEAISYTLLGVRNQLRPEVRKEEEASLRGLPLD